MIKKIILIGAGGHSKSCIDIIESSNEFDIVGLIDNDLDQKKILDYPILGDDSNLLAFRDKVAYAFITVGQIKNANLRENLYNNLVSLNFKIPIIKSSLAYVSPHSSILSGTIVMHGSIVNSAAEVGTNCILNNNSLVEHDCKIGNNSHIATGAILNGGVNIGNNSFIGSNTVIKQNINIGNNCVIGAGLFIKKNINDGVTIK
jgi:sugar O-acyltransferase (sialic acid O-acetyltransferase NeuD family)